jgi:hypothetical protein
MAIGLTELGRQKRFDSSQATEAPTVRPPTQIMFMWSSSTPCRAEK